jgi:large subunit ribosomal protein L13
MYVSRKTFSQNPVDVTRKWLVIDASTAPLGRVATTIAHYLIGKYKTTYTPHVDGGDYVVVINADSIVVTGEKETDKIYYHYSGYPGGMSQETVGERRVKHPERIIEDAVAGMLPKNKLKVARMARLRVFKGAEHTHTAQVPTKVEVK